MTDITCISPIDGAEVARRPIASDAEIALRSPPRAQRRPNGGMFRWPNGRRR